MQDIDVRPGDYANRDQLQKSPEGIDTLLLVSGNGAPEGRIGQHRNVIEAAKAAGVKKIVYGHESPGLIQRFRVSRKTSGSQPDSSKTNLSSTTDVQWLGYGARVATNSRCEAGSDAKTSTQFFSG